MEYLTVFLSISVYVLLGLVIMGLGCFLVDLVVPCSFPDEIRKQNQAVGWIMAGSFISVGTIVKNVIISYDRAEAGSFLHGVLASAVYSMIGVLFLILSYLFLRFVNRRYSLNEEIGKGNAAAGLMVFGIFVGLAQIVSGAVS